MAIVVVCVFIFTLFAILKLFYMQIIKGSEWRETAERQYRKKKIEKKKRGRKKNSRSFERGEMCCKCPIFLSFMTHANPLFFVKIERKKNYSVALRLA